MSRVVAAVCAIAIGLGVYGGVVLRRQQTQLRSQQTQLRSLKAKLVATSAREIRLAKTPSNVATKASVALVEEELHALQAQVVSNAAVPVMSGTSGTANALAISSLQQTVGCLTNAVQQLAEGFRPSVDCGGY